jgi:catalase
VHFVAEAVKHAKAVGALGAGTALLDRVSNGSAQVAGDGDGVTADRGVVSASGTDGSLPQDFVNSFCDALGQHRAWERLTAAVPA